jgi:hypothetical protein
MQWYALLGLVGELEYNGAVKDAVLMLILTCKQDGLWLAHPFIAYVVLFWSVSCSYKYIIRSTCKQDDL